MEQSINEFNYVHYVYRITNNINKKYYIGIHSTKIIYEFKDEDELKNYLISDGYWGSGTSITKAIKKEGLENFTKEILKIFNTREEVLQEESRLVTLDVVRDPQSYNLSLGGYARSNVGTHIRVIDKESGKQLFIEKNLFNSNKNSFIVISSTYGKKWITNGVENKLITKDEKLLTGWRFGKVEPNKTKISQKNYIYKNIITGKEVEKSISYKDWKKKFTDDCLDYPITFFLNSGKFLSYEYLEELYSDCPSWTRIIKNLDMPPWKITIARKFYESLGKVFSSNKKSEIRKPPSTRWILGKTYITNIEDGQCLLVDITELDNYLSSSIWVKGKIRKNLLDNRQNILNDYINLDKGNHLVLIARKYTTVVSKIKIILNLNKNNSKIYYLSKDNKQRHGLYNKEMIDILSKQGWKVVSKIDTVSKTP